MARNWEVEEAVKALRKRSFFRRLPRDVRAALYSWREAEERLAAMNDPAERRTDAYREAIADVRIFKKNAGMQIGDALRVRRIAEPDDVVVDEHGEVMENLEDMAEEIAEREHRRRA